MTSLRERPNRPAGTFVDLGGVIVTAAGPQMREALHEWALPSFQRYAARWNLAVEAVELPADGTGADSAAQRAKWAKIELLRSALRRFPFALWIDADVILNRTDEFVIDHLHPTSFQAFTLEQVPFEHRINPNTGVWLLRSCPMAFAFLNSVERAGPQPGPWADQGAVLAALGWNRGDENYHWAKPGVGNRFSRRTSWLPAGWNQPHVKDRDPDGGFNSAAESYLDRPIVARPHAVHFMGMTPPARLRAMRAFGADQRV
jgi:hypothetical protein